MGITNTMLMEVFQFHADKSTSWELKTPSSLMFQRSSREVQSPQLQICLSRKSTSQKSTIHANMTTSATPATTHMCTIATSATTTTTADTMDAETSTLVTMTTIADTMDAETSTL